MSHTVAIKGVKIMNASALRAAVAELKSARKVNCELVANAVPRSFPGNPMTVADFVLKLPGEKYDVGFYKQKDGSYEPQTDFYGGGVARCIGVQATAPERQQQAQMGQLFQLYAKHAVLEEVLKQGKTARHTVDSKTGEIAIVVSGY